VRILLVILLLGAAGVAAMLAISPSPVSLARIKCADAITYFTKIDVSLTETSRAHVSGDVNTGSVRLPFTASGRQRIAECDFLDGQTMRVTLDGKLLAGSYPPSSSVIEMIETQSPGAKPSPTKR
jgi:hypothetical protein